MLAWHWDKLLSRPRTNRVVRNTFPEKSLRQLMRRNTHNANPTSFNTDTEPGKREKSAHAADQQQQQHKNNQTIIKPGRPRHERRVRERARVSHDDDCTFLSDDDGGRDSGAWYVCVCVYMYTNTTAEGKCECVYVSESHTHTHTHSDTMHTNGFVYIPY